MACSVVDDLPLFRNSPLIKEGRKTMQYHRIQRRIAAIGLLAGVFAALLGGCRFPGAVAPRNVTNATLVITSMNDGNVLLSDVVTQGQGADNIIEVEFKSSLMGLGDEDDADWPDTDIAGPGPLDDILLNRYRVQYLRTDGGQVPGEFTMGIHILIPAESDHTRIQIVAVRGFAKSASPLRQLWERGELTMTAEFTFYGEDGYGNDVVVSSALPICFGNYPDN